MEEKMPGISPVIATSSSTAETTIIGCEMRSNYEFQLQTVQSEQDILREQLAAAKELYEKYGKELSEERIYRKELEGKFATLNEETERKIQCLDLGIVDSFEERIGLLVRKQEADMAVCSEELEMAKKKHSQLQNQLCTLDERYQKLLRINSECAEEMREQQIELPQNLEELQFLALQLREFLINERAAREHETRELRDELTVAREQLLEMEIRDKENEELLMRERNTQQRRRSRHERASASSSALECSFPRTGDDTNGPIDECCPSHRQLLADLESQHVFAQGKIVRLEEMLSESRQRCAQMQNELDTSETVQKDFVRLSQQLQIELEKIRQAEIEVRWQEPDDVSQCNGCNKLFPNTCGDAKDVRVNCKHCGKIFCPACLTHKVPSGSSKRPVTVCTMCYSLLSKEHSLVGELKPEE